MEPATLIAGAIALVFALLAMLQWRRATDLEERVRELEGKLTDALPTLRQGAPAIEPEPEPEPVIEPEPEPVIEPAIERVAEPANEQVAEPVAALEARTEEEEPLAELAPVEPDDEPEAARAEPSRPAAEPDSMRLAALKVVADAFELSRYLDFDFIVEKPSTYRVTVPLTAANGSAVRHLQDGMFPCLKQVRVGDGEAVLHIDTSKGPP